MATNDTMAGLTAGMNGEIGELCGDMKAVVCLVASAIGAVVVAAPQ